MSLPWHRINHAPPAEPQAAAEPGECGGDVHDGLPDHGGSSEESASHAELHTPGAAMPASRHLDDVCCATCCASRAVARKLRLPRR